MVAKAVATACKSTFFNVSASTLMSKWVGDSERLMKHLFGMAAIYSPSIIFIDEIDSMLTARSEGENEAARRVKTEFLIQLDGVGSSSGRVLVMGATNRPFDLDEAALRRMTKRIYIGLPENDARDALIKKQIASVANSLNASDFQTIARKTEGYSSADLAAVSKDAAMQPLREVPPGDILSMDKNSLRPVTKNDFLAALRGMAPSVS
eukprot:CAMPEP_0170455974 /NCGR_PEP_ID=MMETSP0123-20130129/3762_1 /TAXON_ID=182087 /ORGANISM="Favella ehrenbergii, Strain Fehren 1" /LENGTH=207 /DNA_ID=CAMNT_0010719295 /DNA_START=830 /DNA_END=1450 /DNA_ORIENTATION=-